MADRRLEELIAQLRNSPPRYDEKAEEEFRKEHVGPRGLFGTAVAAAATYLLAAGGLSLADYFLGNVLAKSRPNLIARIAEKAGKKAPQTFEELADVFGRISLRKGYYLPRGLYGRPDLRLSNILKLLYGDKLPADAQIDLANKIVPGISVFLTLSTVGGWHSTGILGTALGISTAQILARRFPLGWQQAFPKLAEIIYSGELRITDYPRAFFRFITENVGRYRLRDLFKPEKFKETFEETLKNIARERWNRAYERTVSPIREFIKLAEVAAQGRTAELRQQIKETLTRELYRREQRIPLKTLRQALSTIGIKGLAPVSLVEAAEKFGLEAKFQYAVSVLKPIAPDVVETLINEPLYNLYRGPMGGIFRIPTIGERLINAIDALSRRFVIPYVNFNPLSIFQPTFWRNVLSPRLVYEGIPVVPEALYTNPYSKVAGETDVFVQALRKSGVVVVGGVPFKRTSWRRISKFGEVNVIPVAELSESMKRILALQFGAETENTAQSTQGIIGFLKRVVRIARGKTSLDEAISELYSRDITDEMRAKLLGRVSSLALKLGDFETIERLLANYAASQPIEKVLQVARNKSIHYLTRQARGYINARKSFIPLTESFLQGIIRRSKYTLTREDVLRINYALAELVYQPVERVAEKLGITNPNALKALEDYIQLTRLKAAAGEYLDKIRQLASQRVGEIKLPLQGYLEKWRAQFVPKEFEERVRRAIKGYGRLRRILNLKHRLATPPPHDTLDFGDIFLLPTTSYVPWKHTQPQSFLASLWHSLLPSPDTAPAFGNVLSVFAHFAAYRPYELIEQLSIPAPGKVSTDYEKAGPILRLLRKIPNFYKIEPFLRVSPTNAATTVWAMLMRRVLPGLAIWSAFGYTDYLIESLTGLSPKRGLINLAKSIGVGAATIGQITGFTPLMRRLREEYPGLVPMTFAAGGWTLAGMPGALIGGGIGVLAEQAKTPRETILEYTGKKEVPVRRARWWLLGNEPFAGGRIRYFRPHLLYLAGTEWQYSDVLWGSKKEYYAYKSWLPTPTNWFLLRKLLNPYYYDIRNLPYRPYPVTGPLDIAEFPIIGPLLAIPGYIIKPRINLINMYQKIMTQQALETIYRSYGIVGAASVPSGTGQGAGTAGMIQSGAVGTGGPEAFGAPGALTSGSVTDLVGRSAAYMREYLGFIGWTAATIPQWLSGKYNQQYTTPIIPSTETWQTTWYRFYNLELGAMLGANEFYRRMFPKFYSPYQLQINPLPNMMPDWLPGSDYFIDFRTGDPYAKIPFGEIRLPGPGYEKTHELVDNYGIIDRFLILADVAPYSQQYRRYASIVRDMLPNLPPNVRYRVYSKFVQVERVKRAYEFDYRPFEIPMTSAEYTLEKYLGGGVYQTAEGYYLRLAGVDVSIDALAKQLFETKNISIEEAYAEAAKRTAEAEQILRSLAGGKISVLVPADKGLRYRMLSVNRIEVPAIIPHERNVSLQRELYERGLVAKNLQQTPIDKRAFYEPNLFNVLWEKFAHADWFLGTKLIGARTPLEEYERFVIYGGYRATWEQAMHDIFIASFRRAAARNPIEAFTHGLFTGMFMSASPSIGLGAGVTLGAFESVFSLFAPAVIPAETKRRWEIEEKYEFYEWLRQQAYGERSANFVGLQTAGSVEGAARVLPRIEREFFAEFVNAPAEARDRIRRVVPPYVRRLLEHFWRLKEEGGSTVIEGTEEYLSELYEKYRPTPLDIQLVPEVSLQKARTIEALAAASDLAPYRIYASQIYAASKSLLKDPSIESTPTSYALELAETQLLGYATFPGAIPVFKMGAQPSVTFNVGGFTYAG